MSFNHSKCVSSWWSVQSSGRCLIQPLWGRCSSAEGGQKQPAELFKEETATSNQRTRERALLVRPLKALTGLRHTVGLAQVMIRKLNQPPNVL